MSSVSPDLAIEWEHAAQLEPRDAGIDTSQIEAFLPRKNGAYRYLGCLIANLWAAYPGWVRMPFGEYAYQSDPWKTFGITKTIIVAANALTETGLVEKQHGWFNRASGVGRLTRLRATPKLISMLPQHMPRDPYSRVSLFHEGDLWFPHRTASAIELDKEATIRCLLSQLDNRVQLPDHERKLGDGQSLWRPSRILDGRDHLRLIYKHGGGGRIYGGAWEQMPEHDRLRIKIDGELVSEVDYKALHPSMLYARVGSTMPADPYLPPNWPAECRGVGKVALLCCINADSEDKAFKAINKQVSKERRVETPRPIRKGWVMRLLADLKDHNAPIADYLCTGVGLELQYDDSAMLCEVIKEMLDLGEVVLPVHDSLVCRTAVWRSLEQKMQEAAHRRGIDVATKVTHHHGYTGRETITRPNLLYPEKSLMKAIA